MSLAGSQACRWLRTSERGSRAHPSMARQPTSRPQGRRRGLPCCCVRRFGLNLEYIYGINYLPFTPISEELLEPEWVAAHSPRLQPVSARTRVEGACRAHVGVSA